MEKSMYNDCIVKPFRNMKQGDKFIDNSLQVITVESVTPRLCSAWGKARKRYKRYVWDIVGHDQDGKLYVYSAYSWERPLFSKGDLQ